MRRIQTLNLRARVSIVATALVVTLASCGSDPVTGTPDNDPDLSEAVSNHDLLADQLVRAFNWADQIEIAGSTSDVLAGQSLDPPVRRLRRSYDAARRIALSLDYQALGLTARAEAAGVAEMNTFLDEAGRHLAELEGLAGEPTVDGPMVVREASATRMAIDRAALRHAGLLAVASGSGLGIHDFVETLPRHQLAMGYAAILHDLDRMAMDTEPDWTARWEQGVARILRSLASTRKALSDTEVWDPSVLDALVELDGRDRMIGERLLTLRGELAKPVASRSTAEKELEAIRQAAREAEDLYGEVVATDGTLSYPEYDFSEG